MRVPGEPAARSGWRCPAGDCYMRARGRRRGGRIHGRWSKLALVVRYSAARRRPCGGLSRTARGGGSGRAHRGAHSQSQCGECAGGAAVRIARRRQDVVRAAPHRRVGPPSPLLRLRVGRMLMRYGYRRAPFGNQARISRERSATWSEQCTIWADAASGDLGYPSSCRTEPRGLGPQNSGTRHLRLSAFICGLFCSSAVYPFRVQPER
jgi:hypothetical protein